VSELENIPINRIIYNKSEFKRWFDDVRKEAGLTQSEVVGKSGYSGGNSNQLLFRASLESTIKIANTLGYQILMVPK